MRFFIFAILTACWMSFPSISHACTCESIGPPCQSFWATPVVFSARAVDVKVVAKEVGKKGSGGFTMHVEVRFAVSAEYRGSVGPTVELVTGAGGGDCGYNFEQGREYLVYAHRGADGVLSTGICTPTKALEDAVEDLQFIGSLAIAKPVGSVSGRISEYKNHRSNGAWQPNPPIANLTVELTAKDGRVVTTTNEIGDFRFADLSAGEYELGFSAPEGFAPTTTKAKIRIPEKGCVVKDFAVSRETSVSGRITDADGSPVTKIFAELVPIEQINERYKRDSHVAEIDKNGRFELRFVAPGSYYLGVRLKSSVLKHGYPRTFYPGTQLLGSAVVIIIREGQTLKDLDFQLPKRFAERKVQGIVTFPEGQPVADAYVLVEEVGLGDAEGTRSDTTGRFTLKLFEGLSYKIRAYVTLESGGQRHAHSVEVGPKGPVTNLKIVISEPNGNCARCRP